MVPGRKGGPQDFPDGVNGGGKGMDVHDKDEAMGALEFQIIDILRSMQGVSNIGGKGPDKGAQDRI